MKLAHKLGIGGEQSLVLELLVKVSAFHERVLHGVHLACALWLYRAIILTNLSIELVHGFLLAGPVAQELAKTGKLKIQHKRR